MAKRKNIDVELLLTGLKYEELPDSYVIFICDFDPFGSGKYQYTFEPVCREDPSIYLDDGNHTIFLNTRGKNKAEVFEGLVNFLEYVESGHCNTDTTCRDNFINRLQKAVEDVIKSREMEGRYMQFREMLDEEKAEGKAEGKVEGKVEGKAEDIIDLLSDLGIVPEKLRKKILEEKDLDVLRFYLKNAAAAKYIPEFESRIDEKV